MILRELERGELEAVWGIDRSEHVEGLYRHDKGELVLTGMPFEDEGWDPEEIGVYGPLLEDCFDRGGFFLGAFDGAALAGVVVLDPRPVGGDRDLLQLFFLHVSRAHRRGGLGRTLLEAAARRARGLGASRLYVSSSPSRNAVEFYLHLGCRLAPAPDPQLFAPEPEDIHLQYEIG